MPIYGTWPQDDGYVWLNLLTSLAANSVSWGLLLEFLSVLGSWWFYVQNLGSLGSGFLYGASLCWGLPLLMDHPECLAGRVSRVGARSPGRRTGSWEAWGLVSQTGLFPWIVVLYLFPLIYFSCLFIH